MPLDDRVFRFRENGRYVWSLSEPIPDTISAKDQMSNTWQTLQRYGRKLSPMRNLSKEHAKKLIDDPSTDWYDLARIRRYYKVVLMRGVREKHLLMIVLTLYLEELHTAERTLPWHRHVLSLDEARALRKRVRTLQLPAFLSKPVTPLTDSCYISELSDESAAQRLFRQYVGLDINDYIADWSNIYITGDCIDYCCAQRNYTRSQWFDESPIDFIVDMPAEQFEKCAEMIRSIPFRREVRIRRAPFGSACNNIMPPTRGWYHDGKFLLTFSAMFAINRGDIFEYKAGGTPLSVYRFVERGYDVYLNSGDRRECSGFGYLDWHGTYSKSKFVCPDRHYRTSRARMAAERKIIDPKASYEYVYMNGRYGYVFGRRPPNAR